MVWQGIQCSSQWQNETTIADRRHSLFGHICHLPENTPVSQALQLSIEAHTSTPPAADWKRPPGPARINWLQQVEEDIGLSVGAARIAGQDRSMWRTSRYDPQLVKRSSEWVSEGELREKFFCIFQASAIDRYQRFCKTWEGDICIITRIWHWNGKFSIKQVQSLGFQPVIGYNELSLAACVAQW